jgi:protein-S-isoprenylcysteine O-methyltransferase Ste14
LYSTSLNLLYTIDVVFGAVGYILTMRMLGTHIKSVESTLSGWVVAICCYPPFAGFLWSKNLLGYKGETGWQTWLFDYPVLSISWGFCIVALTVIYAWSTCSFGCRFSNLTNRGIITGGPYALLRHPAYVSKNLAWWMMYVPFATHATGTGNLRATICLLITNLVYYWRAKTEERHLKSDPVYLAYWERMEKDGIVGQFKQVARCWLGRTERGEG